MDPPNFGTPAARMATFATFGPHVALLANLISATAMEMAISGDGSTGLIVPFPHDHSI